jgi:hypothetical protein
MLKLLDILDQSSLIKTSWKNVEEVVLMLHMLWEIWLNTTNSWWTCKPAHYYKICSARSSVKNVSYTQLWWKEPTLTFKNTLKLKDQSSNGTLTHKLMYVSLTYLNSQKTHKEEQQSMIKKTEPKEPSCSTKKEQLMYSTEDKSDTKLMQQITKESPWSPIYKKKM